MLDYLEVNSQVDCNKHQNNINLSIPVHLKDNIKVSH